MGSIMPCNRANSYFEVLALFTTLIIQNFITLFCLPAFFKAKVDEPASGLLIIISRNVQHSTDTFPTTAK